MLIFYPCFFIKTHLYQKQKVDLEITFIPSRSEPTGTMLQFGVIINQLVQISKVYKWVQLKGAISQAKSASKSEKHPKKRSLRRRGGAKRPPFEPQTGLYMKYRTCPRGEQSNRRCSPQFRARCPVYEIKNPYRGFLIIQIIKNPIGIPGTAYRGFLIVGELKVTEQGFL